MQPLDSNGVALDAQFHVEADGPHLALIMKSSSGGERTGRNRQYNKALELLLTRLARMNATMTDALVDSGDTRRMNLPEAARRIPVVPIHLARVQDMEALRRQMGAAQAKIGQASTATKDGNRTKSIRIRLDVPEYGPADADRLAWSLANPNESDEWTVDEVLKRLDQLRIDRSGDQPRLYQPITLLWAIGRMANGEQRMLNWSETRQLLAKLLQHYDQQPYPHLPLAALSQAGLWELDGPRPLPAAHGREAERWFSQNHPDSGLVAPVYELLRNSPEKRNEATAFLLREFFSQHEDWIDILDEVGIGPEPILDDVDLTKALATDALDAALPSSPAESEYARLCEVADRGQRINTDLRKRGVRHDVIYRLASARQAVILRSKGHCENPDCGGEPQDITMSGAPILEVDHVMDLARHGPDYPSNMIALCPNCHAVKTRGKMREELRAKLIVIARQRHEGSLVGT